MKPDPDVQRLAREKLAEGLSLQETSRFAESISFYRDALGLDPNLTAARHMLGLALHQSGHSIEGLAELNLAVSQTPKDPLLLANQASVMLATGHLKEAEIASRSALQIEPDHFGALFNLALILEAAGRPSDAIAACSAALARRPQALRVATTLARLALRLHDTNAAQSALSVLKGSNGVAELLLRGDLCILCGQTNTAWQLWEEAARDSSVAADALFRIARSALHLRRTDVVIRQTQAILTADPDAREAMVLLAVAEHERGEIAAAIVTYRSLLARAPDFVEAESNYLIALQHLPETTPADLLYANRQWATRHAPAAEFMPHKPDVRARPRIAWISPRFADGPVRTFFSRVLAALRRRGDAEHILVMTRRHSDDATQSFSRLADRWIDASGMNDDELFSQLRNLDLDVAVDLAGHAPGNRLLVLARRVAPLQATWLDNFATTGVPAIDIFLSDERLTPESANTAFTERVIRLPTGRLCYMPPNIPESASTPNCSERKPLLVSFNRMAKTSPNMLALWARILRGLDGWRLRLRAEAFSDPEVGPRVRGVFAAHGVDPDRIELEAFGSYADAMNSYREASIALDTFPFGGCATTCDALWMGVPVVTLRGETLVSRQSAALLGQCGLDQLIADSEAQYVEIVKRLATDRGERERLATQMRERVRANLCDSNRFAEALMTALMQNTAGAMPSI